MSESFCIKGTLDLLLKGTITISQCEEIVNIWVKVTREKSYREGWLDGLRSNGKNSAERDENDAVTGLNDFGIQSHRRMLHEVIR